MNDAMGVIPVRDPLKAIVFCEPMINAACMLIRIVFFESCPHWDIRVRYAVQENSVPMWREKVLIPMIKHAPQSLFTKW